MGQAYPDDLAGIAATQQGLQRVVQAVHLHSFRWGWLLGVPKKLISGIYRDASHTAFFKDRSFNQDVMLADLDVLSADDRCRMAHARHYAWQAAAATAAALYARNDPCSPEFDA